MNTTTRITRVDHISRRLAAALLAGLVAVLTIGTSQSAWVDEVRVEARVTFQPSAPAPKVASVPTAVPEAREPLPVESPSATLPG